MVLLPKALGYAPAPPRGMNLVFLLGTRQALSVLLTMPQNALTNAMLITLAFVAARLVVKRTWLAAGIAGIITAFVVVSEAGTEQLALNIVYALAVAAVYVVVLVSFGIFPMALGFLPISSSARAD